MHLKIGTRRSPLAMTQTRHVVSLIQARHPHVEVSLLPIVTVADKDRTSEFHEFRMIGVFSTEHERKLLSGEVDIVVHSLKDLPTTLREGLVLAAVPEREDPRDVLCGADLGSLPHGARIGTGSLRRRAQMLVLRPDVEIVPIRGNVGPRLAKTEGEDALDAVILAHAGLRRLGLEEAGTEILEPELFPYAVGQGALGVEARSADAEILAILKDIEDPEARAAVDAERAMLHTLGAGCSLPVGVHTRWHGGRLVLSGQVTSIDGRQRMVETRDAPASEAEALGRDVGEALQAAGAAAILKASYGNFAHFKLEGA